MAGWPAGEEAAEDGWMEEREGNADKGVDGVLSGDWLYLVVAAVCGGIPEAETVGAWSTCLCALQSSAL